MPNFDEVSEKIKERKEVLLDILDWSKKRNDYPISKDQVPETLTTIIVSLSMSNPKLALILMGEPTPVKTAFQLAFLYGYYTGYQDKQLETMDK